MKNQPALSLTVGCIFLRFRVRSGYRTRQPGYNLRQRMTQQGIPSPVPDAVGYYWGVDQSTAFGFTLRKTEYPAMSWFGLGIPSCVVFPKKTYSISQACRENRCRTIHAENNNSHAVSKKYRTELYVYQTEYVPLQRSEA